MYTMNLAKLMFLEKEWNLVVRNCLSTNDVEEKGFLWARKDVLESRISQEMQQDVSLVRRHYALKFARCCASFQDQRGIKRKREECE